VRALNLDAAYTYDNEGTMTAVTYLAITYASSDPTPVRGTDTPRKYTYSPDTIHRAIG
jgi:hypothetical protein